MIWVKESPPPLSGNASAKKLLRWCTHFKTTRFKTIVETRPGKSACHEEETSRNLLWDDFFVLIK